MKIFRIISRLSKKAIMILVLVIILFGSVVAFFYKKKSAAEADQSVDLKNSTVVEFYNVAHKDYLDQIDILGQITYFEKVTVSSKVNGRLAGLFIHEGKNVRKGEKIAEIEKYPFELSLKQQLAELEIAKRSLDLSKAKYDNALKAIDAKVKTIEKARYDLKEKEAAFKNMERTLSNKKALFEIGGVSETELESVKIQHTSLFATYMKSKNDLDIQEIGFREEDIEKEGWNVPSSQSDKYKLFRKLNTKIEYAEYEAAKAKVNEVEKSVESTRMMLQEADIYSPMNGIVATKDIEKGEMVKTESTISTIMNISDVYIVFNVNEKDIVKVSKNLSVVFKVDALDGLTFEGRIDRISPYLDPKTRTVEVKAVVKNGNHKLLPGMFARADIILGKHKNILAIPLSSLLSKNENSAEVYIVNNKIVVKRKIQTGFEFGDMIEVKNGISDGDKIVMKGINLVYPGMKIK
ncbi:MAG: efflux RND transporter periplasmic adaptor subunit [Spirochaetes bacterium]|nr:efflux RND transporter periplasmic adaptor subunit [Spirochaetota bacterium]